LGRALLRTRKEPKEAGRKKSRTWMELPPVGRKREGDTREKEIGEKEIRDFPRNYA
jgi:hypothetical protein